MKAYIQDKGRKWLQNRWDESDKGRKLYNIDPKVGEKIYRTFGNRLDEIKYNRIRIGHSRLTQRLSTCRRGSSDMHNMPERYHH